MCCHGVSGNNGCHRTPPPAQDITASNGPEGVRNNNTRAQIAANNPLNPMNAPDTFEGKRAHKKHKHHHKHKANNQANPATNDRVAAIRTQFQGVIDRLRRMLPQSPLPTTPLDPNKPAVTAPVSHAPV